MGADSKAVRHLERAVLLGLERAELTGARRLVVAVSGGPDSLSLLYAIHRLRTQTGVDLHGAHLNHNLRGDDSDADAAFFMATMESLGMPFTVEKADVPAHRSAGKLSLEEAARELRYEFLRCVSDDVGADAVALGHTADDQAETVLMHIIRGAGLTGLRGIREDSMMRVGSGSLRLLRPLLGVTRRDVEDYCGALGLKPRTDASNLSSDLARNRVRLELVPELETYNPAVKEALIRLSGSASIDLDYILAIVDAAWQRAATIEDGRTVLDRQAFTRE